MKLICTRAKTTLSFRCSPWITSGVTSGWKVLNSRTATGSDTRAGVTFVNAAPRDQGVFPLPAPGDPAGDLAPSYWKGERVERARNDSSRPDPVLTGAFRRQIRGVTPLSCREREVVELVAQGYASRDIAERMFVTPNTVRNHLHSILNKLHLSHRSEIALWRVGSPQGHDFTDRELRKELRFEISLRVRYWMVDGPQIESSGTGQAMNISSTGVWFTTEGRLNRGTRLHLSVEWPILLNGARPLQLAIEGHVIRSDERGTALAVGRSEFRTRPLRPVLD